MSTTPPLHHRRSIRLKGYDYSQAGLFYITICCQDMAYMFGRIENKKMILNDAGKMVESQWIKIPERFKNIQLHEYVIMPNHFHAILEIVGATLVVAPNPNNPDPIVRATLVVAPNPNNPAAPNNPIALNNGQPQGIAPTNNPIVRAPEMEEPQGIAPTNNPIVRAPEMGKPQGIAPTYTLGNILGAFQSIVTVEYIRGVKTLGWKPFDGKLWQRNYFEHIIRYEKSYIRIADYIISNPATWKDDKLFIQ